MKICLQKLCLLITLAFVSCSLDTTEDTLESVNQKSNVIVLKDNNIIKRDLINLNDQDLIKLDDYRENTTNRIYAYNSVEGELDFINYNPIIKYFSTKGKSLESLNYYVGLPNKNITRRNSLAYINFVIENNLETLVLDISKLKLVNINSDGLFSFNNENWIELNGRDTLVIDINRILSYKDSLVLPINDSIPVIPQIINPWVPIYNPSEFDSYVLLKCKISQELENLSYYIWCSYNYDYDYVAIPIKCDLIAGKKTTINISLDKNYNWYDISGSSPFNVLHEISFDVTVDDWK